MKIFLLRKTSYQTKIVIAASVSHFPEVDGKVVLCFTTVGARAVLTTAASAVREAGGVGVIVARNPSDMLGSCGNDFPCVVVDYELGTRILFYIRSARYQNHCQCYHYHKFQLT